MSGRTPGTHARCDGRERRVEALRVGERHEDFRDPRPDGGGVAIATGIAVRKSSANEGDHN